MYVNLPAAPFFLEYSEISDLIFGHIYNKYFREIVSSM